MRSRSRLCRPSLTLEVFGIAHRLGRVQPRFEVGVQVLVRVEFWAIAGQEEQLDLLGVLGEPFPYLAAVMHTQVVQHQKHLALGLALWRIAPRLPSHRPSGSQPLLPWPAPRWLDIPRQATSGAPAVSARRRAGGGAAA